jgi:hypothetical protein
MTLPDFLVIGAPKAGSTALHAALAQHPALYMSAVKEPKFFLSDGPPPARGGPGDVQTYREHVWRRADYEALFDAAPAGALRGESTPLYLHDPAAHRRMHALVPDAKLIAVLRDPVERAHSNWTHLWSAGLETIDDFVRACEEEPRRIEAGWASFWHYISLGKYAEQLEHLFSLYPREQVLVLRYLSMVDRPAETLDRICTFLDVEPGIITSLPRENVTAHPEATLRYRAMARTLRAAAAAGRFLPGTTGTFLTSPLEHMLQRSAPPRQPLTWDERELVLPKFESDIHLLEKVTGDDFSFWLRPRERSGGMVGSRPTGQRQARNGQPRSAMTADA